MSQNRRSPILSTKGDAVRLSLLTRPTHWLLLTVILIHIQPLVRANGCSPSPLPYATAVPCGKADPISEFLLYKSHKYKCKGDQPFAPTDYCMCINILVNWY